jgi:DNA-directed RNA polymerase subunit M/transcription elongation factor TFIIS
MGVLMLTCPETGREFSTGIHTDEASFKKLPDTVTKAACPSCGQEHSWWTRQARLSDEAEASRGALRHAS